MSEHMSKSLNRPRLCSIRISSEGAATTNILLENAESSRLKCDTVNIVSLTQSIETQPHLNNHIHPPAIEKQVQVYTKRSKYLDEELDDSKEVIVCVDKRPSISRDATEGPTTLLDNTLDDSPGRQSKAALLIELNNKTDSEKYRETHPGAIVVDNGVVKSTGGVVGVDQSAFLMDDPVPVVESLHVMNIMTQTAAPTLMIHANNKNNNNITLNNGHSLRQEQLDRVAVWVQQSNENQKQNHTTTTDNHHHHHSYEDVQEGRKGNNHMISGSNVSQLASSSSPVSYANDGAVCIDIEEDHHHHQSQGTGTGLAAMDSSVASSQQQHNIAQMEYNVKQFLLKQNEWSIGGGGTGGEGLVSAVPGQVNLNNNHLTGSNALYSPMSSSMSITSLTSNNQRPQKNLRTETNL